MHQGPGEMTATLAATFRSWCREPPWRHGAAILCLALVLVVRWQSVVLWQGAVNDERLYLAAFRLAAAGESPFQLNYNYFPVMAIAGGALQEQIGAVWTLVAMRAVNLLGLATVTWFSLAWLPWTWRVRLAAGAAFLCLAPAVMMGVHWGNLSLAVVGLVTATLFIWRSRPILAGVALAASLVIKPIAPLAVFVLAVHRPPEGGRRHLLAAMVAGVLTVALVLPFPYLEDMLALGADRRESFRSIALQHVLYCFGLEIGAWPLIAAVAAASFLWVRRRTLPPAYFFAVAATATLLATPIVWNHTMLVALPLEVLALQVAYGRRKALAGAAPVLRRYEMWFVVLLVLAVQFSGGMGGILKWPVWVQGIVKAVPCFTPAILTGYLVRNTENF